MASDRTIDMLARLVGFDTTSRHANLPLIEHVEAYFEDLGIAYERIGERHADKKNLFVTIGPADRPGIVLSGHTDVVPVDGQDWSSDPFTLVKRGGRLYGRGSTDMKGFVAVCLALVPEMQAAELKIPIHLALSYDEEVGCLGVRELLVMLTARPVRPLGCIVGEPTDMQVVIAHKSKRAFTVTLRGLGGHSARNMSAVNAVEHGARIVAGVAEIGRRWEREGARDALFDVPHSTAHVGLFHGGTALNIVPDEAHMELEFRVLPEDDSDAPVAELKALAAEIEREMRERFDGASVEVALKSEIPGLATAPEDEIVTLAKRLAGRNDHAKVAYGTEAGLFVDMANIPTIVCGPGSIAQAHKPDEFVSEDQLAACEAFVRRLIAHCSA
ncbi:acetylornithine deacetylase [Hansschlegelia quercus]|uniref:Acetylornithine deacetylase n=1 Tax=Hansschlegelia quercus TaxID=2528245 RepID=A0A4Q9GMY2_9HYPH|nr:acetylornithine deacetylase [Hansschlegelia quercus]TBN51835.1 acetylornithine deacetylase [Hansschlegelia quercus]